MLAERENRTELVTLLRAAPRPGPGEMDELDGRQVAHSTPATGACGRTVKKTRIVFLDLLGDDDLSLILDRCGEMTLRELYATCQRMRTPVGDRLRRTLTIALIAARPHDYLGVYTCCRSTVNGRPTYKSAGGKWQIWRTNLHWRVGVWEEAGSHRGELRARDVSADRVEHVKRHWKRWDDDEWIVAPHVRCLHGDALAARLASAAPVIALYSKRPQLNHILFGAYEKREACVNGFPSYVKMDDPMIMMWWSHTSGKWWIGSARSVGTARGYGNARGLLPELAHTWRGRPGVTTPVNTPWIDMLEVTCLHGESLSATREEGASPYVALVGTIPDGHALAAQVRLHACNCPAASS